MIKLLPYLITLSVWSQKGFKSSTEHRVNAVLTLNRKFNLYNVWSLNGLKLLKLKLNMTILFDGVDEFINQLTAVSLSEGSLCYV